MIGTILNFIMAPTGYAAFTVLAIKSTAVISLGLLLWLILRRAPASARHMVLGATLVAMMLLPVIAVVSPPLQLTVQNHHVQAAAPGDAQISLTEFGSAISTTEATSATTSKTAPETSSRSVADYLIATYLCGVALVLLHLLIGIGRVSLITRRARHSTSGNWQGLLPGQHRDRAQLMITGELDAPLTWGARNPVVLMPADAKLWNDQDVQNALLHELAHVERRDWLMQIIARLICAVYWFNPLVWLALHHLTLEAELAADDRVLVNGAAPEGYAEQLVTLSQKSRGTHLPIAATTMAEQSFLSRRVYSILNSGEQRMPLNQINKYALLSIVTFSAMLIGSAQLVAAPQEGAGVSGDTNMETVSTPLILAAAKGDNDEVVRLLRAGADVNETSGNRGSRRELSRSALTTAAGHGHPEVVKTLVGAGAPVDRIVRGDATALIAATRNNHFNVTKQLVEYGADVNKVVRGDGSPLIAATRANNTEAVRFLLEQGADADRSVRGDENPLYHAARNGNSEILELLINAGVDVDQEWHGDGTALIAASKSGNDAAVERLMLAGARPDQGVRGDGNAMIVAAQRGDTAILQKMIETGADVNASVRGDGSPLIQAARNGHMDAVVLLVQAGADVNQVVYGDENALIGAARAGDIEMVDYLLRNGADPTIKARTYLGKTRTALSQASLEGHDDVVRMLRNAGATE